MDMTPSLHYDNIEELWTLVVPLSGSGSELVLSLDRSELLDMFVAFADLPRDGDRPISISRADLTIECDNSMATLRLGTDGGHQTLAALTVAQTAHLLGLLAEEFDQ